MLASVDLIFQSLAPADASLGAPDLPLMAEYPCEDVARCYSGTEQLVGVDLMRRLSSVVSGQGPLQYREVWDAFKILDAANVDNPEASSDVIEVYSTRAVPKILAGKPDGWNREHVWPRSYGLVDAASLTDLHSLRPADVNGKMGDYGLYYRCRSSSDG